MQPNSAPNLSATLDSSLSSTLINGGLIGTLFSDDTMLGARRMGTLDGTQTHRNSLSSTDTTDYYRFRAGTGYGDDRVNITLRDLSSDLDIRLLDSNGTLMQASMRGGSNDESINFSNLQLGQDYYIQVNRYSGDSSYTLSVSNGRTSNLLANESDLGTLSGLQTRTGYISDANTADQYSFSLSGNHNVTLNLTGLSADSDLRLIRDGNGNGIVDDGEELVRSGVGGNTSESLSLQGLGWGRYIAQVFQFSGNTAYSLSLNAVAGNGFATESNNTLGTAFDIGGAGKLGTLSGGRSFAGSVRGFGIVSDPTDIYRFSVGTESSFYASLTGLTADANLRIIRDANYNGLVDDGEVLGLSTQAGTLSESISLSNLVAGTYYLQVDAVSWGTANYNLNFSAYANNQFNSFTVVDGSGDSSAQQVFRDGSLKVGFDFAGWSNITNVRLEALQDGVLVANLGSWDGGSDRRNAVVNLDNYSSMVAGNYQIRAIARDQWGYEYTSADRNITIVDWARTNGGFQTDTFDYSSATTTGSVYLGRGGTDRLNLGIERSQIVGFNGSSLDYYNPLYSTYNQAVLGGSSFDYITLADGREIYLQGIEQLGFSDGTSFDLTVQPNDTYYGQQWNLHVSDVSSAWRFTRGSSSVMLSSIDTGLLGPAGSGRGVHDMTNSRLVTDPTDDDNYGGNGHGHQAISVMSATANNGSGIAGINWNSTMYVTDVYGGVNLRQAIVDTLAYARANNKRVVFQGGIQGEGWLNSGGTQAELETLIRDNSDIAFFAIAAGNGNVDVSDTTTSPGLSAGVARLQGSHGNVMAVGALVATGMNSVDGLTNATSVDRAGYSNYGNGLTLMAVTNSPAIDAFGNYSTFTGTSCANPNMAGMASLVWSANQYLSGSQLRQILIDTSMDLGVAGRDTSFGHGLVNADAAVRRAAALNQNHDVANLYSGRNIFA